MLDFIKWTVFKLVLAPLIRRNYRLREAGKLPDEWYWADELRMKWGISQCLTG